MTLFERYRSEFEALPGWFSREATALWDSLLTRQDTAGVMGNLLEIGVWKGKSAALSTMHARPDEHCVLVDVLPLTEAQAAIGRIRTENMHYLVMPSSDLTKTNLMGGDARTFRWIHIDGEHSGPAVSNDLEIANVLLSDRGVLVLDDFFNPIYPQVTRAALRFLDARPYDLTLFLCGFNKGYICRPRAAREYLEYIKGRLHGDMAERGCPEVTVFKTTDTADMNCFGIGPRMQDFDYRGPDWAQKDIAI